LRTRRDTAARIIGLLAFACTRDPVGVVFVNYGDLENAFSQFMRDRIFDDVWPLGRRALHDIGAALEPMHSKGGDIGHSTASMDVPFTVPLERRLFGLVHEAGRVKVYGSGLISSHGDAANALGDKCDRRPFSLDAVLAQPFEIDRLQDVLFVVDDYKQLFEAVEEAGARMQL